MVVRLGERVEGVGDAVETDRPGHERGGVDLPVGEHAKGVSELERATSWY